MKKPRAKRYVEADHLKERAAFWKVEVRTMQRLIQKRVPVDDTAGTIKWYSGLSGASQSKLTADFRRRLLELRVDLEHKGTGGGSSDPDFADFDKSYKPNLSDDRDTMGAMKRQRAYYLFKLTKAQERNDYAGAAEATKHLTYFAKVIHDAEISALRLGRDTGELFAGDEVDRVFRAIAFWLMAGADTMITQLAKGLEDAAAAAPERRLDREAVRKVIEPVILMERVLGPIARSAKLRAGVSVPKRFTDAMRAGAAAVLEDGAAEFERIFPPHDLTLPLSSATATTRDK